VEDGGGEGEGEVAFLSAVLEKGTIAQGLISTFHLFFSFPFFLLFFEKTNMILRTREKKEGKR